MARAKSTLDTFTAIAEPKRRALIETLAGRALSVNEITEEMAWTQPTASKHLAVLKQVGLVTETKNGRQRVYQLQAEQLKPLQSWVSQFERYWQGSLDNLETYLETLQAKENNNEQ